MSMLRNYLRESIYLTQQQKIAALRSKAAAFEAAIDADEAVYESDLTTMQKTDLPEVYYDPNTGWAWCWGGDEETLFSKFSVRFDELLD